MRMALPTNEIENYWRVLKRTINGTYFKVIRKHPQRYRNESSFRFNTIEMIAQERFDMVPVFRS